MYFPFQADMYRFHIVCIDFMYMYIFHLDLCDNVFLLAATLPLGTVT